MQGCSSQSEVSRRDNGACVGEGCQRFGGSEIDTLTDDARGVGQGVELGKGAGRDTQRTHQLEGSLIDPVLRDRSHLFIASNGGSARKSIGVSRGNRIDIRHLIQHGIHRGEIGGTKLQADQFTRRLQRIDVCIDDHDAEMSVCSHGRGCTGSRSRGGVGRRSRGSRIGEFSRVRPRGHEHLDGTGQIRLTDGAESTVDEGSIGGPQIVVRVGSRDARIGRRCDVFGLDVDDAVGSDPGVFQFEIVSLETNPSGQIGGEGEGSL